MAQSGKRSAVRARGALRRSADGAAAVEFALVSTFLFMLLFGILQYGLYFNDALNTRQGVREAVRQGVVENFAFRSGCTTGGSSAKLRCSAGKEIGAVTGTAYVKVMAASTPWKQGNALIVCAMVHADAGLGIVPMPNGSWVRSRTQMSIEQQTAAATWTDSEDDLGGTGQNWSWCTA